MFYGDRVITFFLWVITCDLSGMEDISSSYATASTARRIVWPRKPHHYVEEELRPGGWENL